MANRVSNEYKTSDKKNVKGLGNTDKVKRKKTYFWKIYAGITIAACIIVIGLWALLWNFLSAYEGSQPEHVIEELVQKFENADTEQLMNYIEFKTSDFESEQIVKDYVTSKLGEGEWNYSKKAGEYSKDIPVYSIKKDGSEIATASLEKGSEKGSFNTATWKVRSIDNIIGEEKSYTITVPQNSKVTVNGVALDESYITEDNVEPTNLGNVTKYIKTPKMTSYQVSGFLAEPEVHAVGPVYQSELELDSDENGKLLYGFESTEDFRQQQENRIIEITKIYGNYVTNDVRYDALSKYILSGSYAVTYLKNIAKTNIWTAAHSANSYDDLKVYNYQIYTDTCFSCEVKFDLVIHTASQDFTYPTHIKYVFIKSGNNWYVADMSLKQ